ncbi:MAG: thermonuclease family protein [Alphaproteobacteria bacterium]|nr:thermonuclease family protein [Alphaproteobacteria bacterium]
MPRANRNGTGRKSRDAFASAALLLTSVFILAGPAQAENDTGVVKGTAQVIDARTLAIDGRNISLYGVTTPRMSDWPWGPFARAALDELAHGKPVSCLVIETDRHRQPVARCNVPGDSLVGEKTLGEAMIRAGWATHHRLATHGRAPAGLIDRYDDAEDAARSEKVGIWGLK